VTRRQGRKRKQLLDDFKRKREYWKLKEEAIDCTLWRTGFAKSYGLVVKTDYEVNESSLIQALAFSVGSNYFFLVTQRIEGKTVKTICVTPRVNKEKHGGTFNCIGL
jgi:hypothetical protein